MQTHEHRSHLVGWRFEYQIISPAKFKVVRLWQKRRGYFVEFVVVVIVIVVVGLFSLL